MTKTENYQLNQWDLEDRVTHTDFNDDNAKLDAVLMGKADLSALNALQDSLATLQAAFETLQAKALTSSGAVYMPGAYTGNGAATQTITLSFTPRALLLFSSRGYTYSGVAHTGGLTFQNFPVSEAGLSIITNGFQVSYGGSGSSIQTNAPNIVYQYLAFK